MNDVALALSLLAVEARLGGMILRDDADGLAALLPEGVPVRRVPPGVDLERMAGALDVAATLAAGRPVHEQGLIAAATGGFLIVPMAERLAPEIVGVLAAALDAGAARVILLDSGGPDDSVAAALADRLAFHLVAAQQAPVAAPARSNVDDPACIVAIADALGVASARAASFAWQVARATGDLATAVRLVLAPRATRWPEPAAPPGELPPTPEVESGGAAADVVLDAVRTMLPADAVAAIVARNTRVGNGGRSTGGRARSRTRGRPAGHKAGVPRNGARLALIATLRAAVPWQRLRGRDGRIRIRAADLRVRRTVPRVAVTTIFAVDASGSAAAARMAEAKGAVELLLTRAYAERAQVALVAFRGEGAEVLLPPTRSLTRARRLLADLPGGGATPLAAGLAEARRLALAERARDRAPRIVVLTDGRANMPRDIGQQEAERAAAAIAREGLPATVIDISQRPRAEGRALAGAMHARYVALPRADAAALSAALA